MVAFLRQLPNIISGIRLILVPVFAWVFFSGKPLWQAGLLYLIAGLSDLLDGYLARRNGWTSGLGKVLDPLADKLLQLTGFVCLAIRRLIPLWALWIVLVKELLMLSGGSVLLKKDGEVPPSNGFGKFASFVFYMVTLVFLVLHPGRALQTVILAIALLCSVCAFGIYASGVIRARRRLQSPSGKE